MISIKLKYKAVSPKSDEGTIYFQVIYKRVIKCIPVNCRISTSEWDGENMRITMSDKERRAYLLSVFDHAEHCREILNTVIASLKTKGDEFTADDIVSQYGAEYRAHSFFSFMQTVIDSIGRLGRIGTRQTYVSTYKSFTTFRNGKDIILDDIDSKLMLSYEAWLRTRGVALNTISFYMRILRAVYNRAVEAGVIKQASPFRHVYTGVAKTIKRAIPLRSIKKLKALDLRHDSASEFARDMFLFSFYTRGMSFVDMSFLKKDDLKNGVLTYRRRKTGQTLQIKWEKNMQEIVNKYPADGSPYLLPVIKKSGSDEWRQYESAIHAVNRKLKKVAVLAGLHCNLTMYVSRHSWASIARSKNVPLAVISRGMGHESEKTTQIYLSSIESSAVDRANLLILKAL